MEEKIDEISFDWGKKSDWYVDAAIKEIFDDNTYERFFEVEEGDIVYCKVKGNFYTHLVKAKNSDKGLLIGNNRGGINGWTKNVYGKVVEIIKN